MKRRVAITGLGVVSSVGIGWQEFWKNLLAGKSGISEVDYFDTKDYDRKLAGQIKNFQPEKFISKSKISHLGRASQLAIAAAKLAVKDAGLLEKSECLQKAAVMIGTTMGESEVLEVMNKLYVADKKNMIKKAMIPIYPANLICENIAREFSIKGFNLLFGNACAAGNFASGYAFDLIRDGILNMALIGGVDAFSKVAYTGFHRLIAIATDNCRPFDKNRSGMIPGEGAGILIIEELEHAKARGAKIYAEIIGFGAASDAYHMTQPNLRGGIKAIAKALKDANIGSDAVDYISAHGTGTLENDKAECEAFHTIFGKKFKDIPASSIKSMLGHTMGAAAALEAVVCCLAIKDGKLPPTINYETPDPECDIDCVPNKCREHKVKIALNNSLAFGGNDSSILLKNF